MLLSLFISPLHAEITVGSKNFTESYILAEIFSKVIEQELGEPVDKKLGLGGTGLVYQALLNDELDLYPEYTGTLSEAILKNPKLTNLEDIRRAAEKKGLVMSDPLGFNNTYALAVSKSLGRMLNLSKISDLAKHPDLKAAFSYEFVKRKDGVEALSRHYGFTFKNINPMEHSLSYVALAERKVDVIDVYTTDAKLQKLDLLILEDDKDFFPRYDAVILARKTFVRDYPFVWRSLRGLEGKINGELMRHLNGLVELDKKTFSQAADIYLKSLTWLKLERQSQMPLKTPEPRTRYMNPERPKTYREKLIDLTQEHMFLVGVSVGAAVIIGIPLGILAVKSRFFGQFIINAVSVFQTIPALALLCFLIPFLGIGTGPSLAALFLYGLLPIVRSTYSGLQGINPTLIESSRALGLTSRQQLIHVELPLSAVHIMGGIKTSAVINVGTATLAALIGAGGYGTLIVTGLALNDVVLILQGALPAAVLAILMNWFFEFLDLFVIPKGLRI